MGDIETSSEYFKYDDPTGIDSSDKEKAFLTIYDCILEVSENAFEWEPVSEDVKGVKLDEIHDYIKSLPYRNDLPGKAPSILYADVSDPSIFAKLCMHTKVYPEKEFPYDKKRIYFIEARKAALTLIPIRRDDDIIHIHMELFHMSPEFIQLIQKEASGSKGIDRIKFKKASELKPKPKPRI